MPDGCKLTAEPGPVTDVSPAAALTLGGAHGKYWIYRINADANDKTAGSTKGGALRDSLRFSAYARQYIRLTSGGFYIFLISLENFTLKQIKVVVAARMSAMGSARKTAKTLSAKNRGRIKISGMSKIIFRSSARKRDILASPKATKVCWQEFCTPMANAPAR